MVLVAPVVASVILIVGVLEDHCIKWSVSLPYKILVLTKVPEASSIQTTKLEALPQLPPVKVVVTLKDREPAVCELALKDIIIPNINAKTVCIIIDFIFILDKN